MLHTCIVYIVSCGYRFAWTILERTRRTMALPSQGRGLLAQTLDAMFPAICLIEQGPSRINFPAVSIDVRRKPRHLLGQSYSRKENSQSSQ